MMGARIVLVLSPLLVFLPPLLPFRRDLGLSLLGIFYGIVLLRFPWNIVMAGVCYNYAKLLGREPFFWAVGSFVFPFLTPLILAFVPAKPGSRAAERKRAQPAPVFSRRATAPFEERFPLLERYLSGKPEAIRAEQMARFETVDANLEFSLYADPSTLDRILAEAEVRKFTVWADTGESGTHLFGAGRVRSDGVSEVIAWLRGVRAPGKKLMLEVLQAGGDRKFFEYLPE
jgi:hypothetical protein